MISQFLLNNTFVVHFDFSNSNYTNTHNNFHSSKWKNSISNELDLSQNEMTSDKFIIIYYQSIYGKYQLIYESRRSEMERR